MSEIIKRMILFNASHPYDIICEYPHRAPSHLPKSIFEAKILTYEVFNRHIMAQSSNVHSAILTVSNETPILLIPSMFLATEYCLAVTFNASTESVYDAFTSEKCNMLVSIDTESFKLPSVREIAPDKAVHNNLIALIQKLQTAFYQNASGIDKNPRHDIIVNAAKSIGEIINYELICNDEINGEPFSVHNIFDRDVCALFLWLSLTVFARECEPGSAYISVKNELGNLTIGISAPLRPRSPLRDFEASCNEFDECRTIAEQLKMHFYSITDRDASLFVLFAPLRRNWGLLSFKQPNIFSYT